MQRFCALTVSRGREEEEEEEGDREEKKRRGKKEKRVLPLDIVGFYGAVAWKFGHLLFPATHRHPNNTVH